MTPREFKVLKFVSDFIAVHGYSPSYSEITAGCGYNKNGRSGVATAVNRLVEQGYLAKPQERRARNLQVLKLPFGHTCAACGRAAA